MDLFDVVNAQVEKRRPCFTGLILADSILDANGHTLRLHIRDGERTVSRSFSPDWDAPYIAKLADEIITELWPEC